MPKKLLQDMTDEELAEERIRLDQEMGELRAQKKLIQDEVDRRYTPPASGPGVHQIGG